MNEQPYSLPTLCLDLKKHCLRIHKKTLYLLGNPDYIQLLIHPALNLIALRKCAPTEQCRHRIRPRFFTTDNCYELTSKRLFEDLCTLSFDWKKEGSYKITGILYSGECLALFDLKDCIPANRFNIKGQETNDE